MSHGNNPTTAELSPWEGDHAAGKGESVQHVFSVPLQRRLREDGIEAPGSADPGFVNEATPPNFLIFSLDVLPLFRSGM